MANTREWQTGEEFMTTPCPKRETLIYPWLPVRGIGLLWAQRGATKTLTCMSLAMGVAAGFSVLNFPIYKARRVLYIDAEMDRGEFQQRLFSLERGMGFPGVWRQNLAIYGWYHLTGLNGFPDIYDPLSLGRHKIWQATQEHDAELVILDNLSTLGLSGDENSAESWNSMVQWLLKFRGNNQSVLLVHHSGKPDSRGNTRQRGTSKREDQLDVAVGLKFISAIKGQPVLTEWEFTKARSFQPEPIFQYEAHFQDEAPKSCRLTRSDNPIDDIRELQELRAKGLTVREIAEKSGISPTTVHRKLRRLKQGQADC